MSKSTMHAAFVVVAPALFVLLWSTGFVGGRFVIPYADPLTFTSIRFAIVVALLVSFVSISRRRQFPRQLSMWGHLAVSGVLIHAGFVGGVFIALDLGVDIGIASLIAGTQPLLTAIVVIPLLGETLSRRQWVGFVVGFLGLMMVVLKAMEVGALPFWGLVGCIVGLCGITFGSLYQKRFVVGIDLLTGSMIQFSAALIPCLLWAFMFETRTIEWNTTVILTLFWMCLGLSIGAITTLLFLIREGAASRVSSLFYLVPPVTAVQGFWLFGERLSALQVAGIGMAAIGVALINSTSERPEAKS
jgi:drug/metabolite transporter (DMT)-like permease